MKVKANFLKFSTFIIKDGSQIKFWEDVWLGNRSLHEQYPQLYNIVRKKQDTMAEVLSSGTPIYLGEEIYYITMDLPKILSETHY